MSIDASNAELHDQVQGLPLTGYGLDYTHMRTLILKVVNPADARKFLRGLLATDLVDFGGKATGRAQGEINIGFTREGLRMLGTPPRLLAVLDGKSPAFGEGAALRGTRLGDTGASSPDRWKQVFQHQTAHIWIAIHGKNAEQLEAAQGRLIGLPGASTGIAGWNHSDHVPDAKHMPDPKDNKIRFVHFGLRDNVTKPGIVDDKGELPVPVREPRDGPVRRVVPFPSLAPEPKPKDYRKPPPVLLPPGELLLGYTNSAASNVWTPKDTPGDVVAFLRNGSFGVLRQIKQDVALLNDFLKAQGDTLRKTYPFVTEAYLKAKLSGRWANGAPVLPHQTEQPDSWDAEMNFDADPYGYGCPFGAHVRRANPRTDPLMPKRDRHLFRRGVPYGPEYPCKDEKTVERGLVGVFFCSLIDDQFEQLISEWLEKTPLGPPNRGHAKDPLSGNHDEPSAEFHIPLAGGNAFVLRDFEPFVRTRGTLYALFPSRSALTMLAHQSWGGS